MIKILQAGDDQVLMNVAAGLFDNPIDARLTKEFLEDPRHHIAVAIDDGKVVAFASGVHYVHPDKPPELWVNEVSVAPTHQRRGLGKAVLRALLEVGKSHNRTAAWVLTHRGNPAAIALYSSVGGIEGAEGGLGISDDVVGFSFFLVDTVTHPSTSPIPSALPDGVMQRLALMPSGSARQAAGARRQIGMSK